MIGPNYWSTGITVWCTHPERDEWGAEATFLDDGFCDIASSEGVLRARYAAPLNHVVSLVKADAERLGIVFQYPDGGPRIYYKGDGEDPTYPAPAGWRLRLEAIARCIGWRSPYTPKEAA